MIRQFYKSISNPAIIIVFLPSITILTTGTLFYWIKPPPLPPKMKHVSFCAFITDNENGEL